MIVLALVPSLSFSTEGLTFLDYKDPNSAKFKDPNLTPDEICFQGAHCFSYQDQQWIKYGGKSGLSNIENITVNEIRRTRDSIIFDASYSIDERGRRNSPVPYKDQNHFAVFFGGSFTFGTGLNDDQTLPVAFAKECPHYRPYNYAVGGTGTNSALSIAEKLNTSPELNSKKGAFFYIYINDHVPRSLGILPSLAWLKISPRYSHDAREFLGSFETANPWKTKALLFLHEYVPFFSNRIFPSVSDRDYEYVCHLVVRMKENLLMSNPDAQFVFYKHPLEGLPIPEKLQNCLGNNRINFLNSHLSPNQEFMIPIDGHPTEFANQQIAKELAQHVGCAPTKS